MIMSDYYPSNKASSRRMPCFFVMSRIARARAYIHQEMPEICFRKFKCGFFYLNYGRRI